MATRVAVVGAGPGGYAAGVLARHQGQQGTRVETEKKNGGV